MVSGYTRVLEKFEDSKGVIRGPKSSRTDNTMAKRRTDNTMAKKERQTIQWPKEEGQTM
jgi:hypothetical protein